jgi:hypothetical protein
MGCDGAAGHAAVTRKADAGLGALFAKFTTSKHRLSATEKTITAQSAGTLHTLSAA